MTCPIVEGQAQPRQATPTNLPSEKLKVFILQGQGATNFIPDRRATTPIVEVRDENELPIEGADVRFDLPASGPGGVFASGEHSTTIKTNVEGQAGAPFILNTEAGRFQITVTASVANKVGSATIVQTNSLQTVESAGVKKRHWYTNWKYLTPIAAGVVVVAVILATHGGSSNGSSSSTPTVTITPGSPTIGGPH